MILLNIMHKNAVEIVRNGIFRGKVNIFVGKSVAD